MLIEYFSVTYLANNARQISLFGLTPQRIDTEATTFRNREATSQKREKMKNKIL